MEFPEGAHIKPPGGIGLLGGFLFMPKGADNMASKAKFIPYWGS